MCNLDEKAHDDLGCDVGLTDQNIFFFCNMCESFATERWAQRSQSLRDNRTLAGAERVQEEETLCNIATKLEADDHKKEMTMVVTLCGHMPYVNKIVWLARHDAWDVFAKWLPESHHLGISQLLEDNVKFRNTSADDNMAKLPSFLECADWVDVVQNQGFWNLITTSEAMKEAVTGSGPTELLHAVNGAIMKDLTHIKCTCKDYFASLLPDWDVITQTSPGPSNRTLPWTVRLSPSTSPPTSTI